MRLLHKPPLQRLDGKTGFSAKYQDFSHSMMFINTDTGDLSSCCLLETMHTIQTVQVYYTKISKSRNLGIMVLLCIICIIEMAMMAVE